MPYTEGSFTRIKDRKHFQGGSDAHRVETAINFAAIRKALVNKKTVFFTVMTAAGYRLIVELVVFP